MASSVLETLDLVQLYKRRDFLLNQLDKINGYIHIKLQELQEESNKNEICIDNKNIDINNEKTIDIINKETNNKIVIRIKKISIKK